MRLGRKWALAAPVRTYVRHFPVNRGKRWLIERILLPMLPADPAEFVAPLPGGGLVRLRPRETLGMAAMIYGGFEPAEVACAVELASPGGTAFDIGANIGIFSVALALAVGTEGQVVAIEPDRTSTRRLRANIELNSMSNVRVCEAVASDQEGAVELQLADDRAFHSLTGVESGHVAVGTTMVRSVRVDSLWQEMGRPDVSVVKIDVEGAEVLVLRGAREMLAATRPALLVEANGEARLASIRSELDPLGYRRVNRRGFQPWNHLLVPTEG